MDAARAQWVAASRRTYRAPASPFRCRKGRRARSVPGRCVRRTYAATTLLPRYRAPCAAARAAPRSASSPGFTDSSVRVSEKRENFVFTSTG